MRHLPCTIPMRERKREWCGVVASMGETRTVRKRSASLLLAALLSATLGAVGCSGQGNAPQEGPAQVEGVEAEAGEGTDDLTMADYRTGTPWLCIDLDGVVTPDTAADITDKLRLP